MQAGKTLWQSIVWRGLYYVSAFIINILIARHFQASVSGAVYYISSIYALAVLVSGLSLESGIIYFASKNGIPLSRLFGFSVVWSLLMGMLVLLTVYLFFTNAYAAIPPGLLLLSSVCFICGNLLSSYCTGFFYAKNNFRIPNIIYVITTVLLIVLIPYHGRSVIPAINNDNYFYLYFISFLVQGICIAVAAKIKYISNGLRYFLSIQEFRLLFGYCALAFTANIVFLLLCRIDYFFVERYCTAGELGNYIQVSKLVNLFFILPTILASVVFPVTAGGQKTGMADMLGILSRCIFIAYFFACIFLVFTGRSLFPYLFGESFSQMYEPFLLFIPGILAMSGLFTISAYFAGANKVKFNITCSLIGLAVMIAGDIIFIPRYGIRAAAAISSLAYVACQVYALIMINRELKTGIIDLYLFRFADINRIKAFFLSNKVTGR